MHSIDLLSENRLQDAVTKFQSWRHQNFRPSPIVVLTRGCCTPLDKPLK
jgi:hypothetical protein